jgi:hypothetical protein
MRGDGDDDLKKLSDCDSQGSAGQAVSSFETASACCGEEWCSTLVPEVPLKSLKGALKWISKTDLREKK